MIESHGASTDIALKLDASQLILTEENRHYPEAPHFGHELHIPLPYYQLANTRLPTISMLTKSREKSGLTESEPRVLLISRWKRRGYREYLLRM